MKEKAKVDWASLGFDYMPTDYNIRCHYKNGQWGALEVSSEEEIGIFMGAACLHYGQQAFEGLKVFEGADGQVRAFRPEENAKRLQASCRRILMPELPKELFLEAVEQVIRLNERFIPPYDSGASLYLRPLMIGLTPNVVVAPATEFLFVLFATPVGPYFKSGIKPCSMAILRDYDRAAPLGTGAYKVGGNYASGFYAYNLAKEKGYASAIYLDAKEKQYLDECVAANFFAIKDNTYITPKSSTILPSITNKSLMQIARDMGLEVEERPVHIDELAEFEEVGACGTGAVISPIGVIDDLDTGARYSYCPNGEAGAVSLALYQHLQDIQYGRREDKHKWNKIYAL